MSSLLGAYLATASAPIANAPASPVGSTVNPPIMVPNDDADDATYDESAIGSLPDLIDLTERERVGGEPIITQTSHLKRPRVDGGRFPEYGLQIVRRLDKEGQTIRTELVIYSPHICKALREILSAYAFYNLAADPIVIAKPYAPLFHYRKEVKSYAESSERSHEEREHLYALLDKFYEPYLRETQLIFDEEIPKGRVRFAYLWTLFRAEDEVLHHTEHFRELHRVMHCEQRVIQDEEVFCIYTWRWGYQNGKFGPCAETLMIQKFSSTREIQQLLCFPIKLLEPTEQDPIYKALIQRGMKWGTLMKPTHRDYHGPMWVRQQGKESRSMSDLGIRFTSGRVVLDHQLHSEGHPYLNDQLIGIHGYRLNGREAIDNLRSAGFPAVRGRSNGTTTATNRSTAGKIIFNQAQCHSEDDYIMTDEEALLCPARARGFSLAEKTFAFFLVEKLDTIGFQEESFRSLVLRDDYKSIVRALVETHDPSIPDFDDVVSGKGRGVVLSLEGPPGSGKTLTAESVAELTHKPLYAISTGELGTEVVHAERALKAVFQRAKRWRAVVLLDEADHFLIKRSVGELERNALVTVFLRTLEYFEGIMFLTTNRVEDFDPAFNSRIHLRLHYALPNSDVRSIIWKNLLPGDWSQNICDRLSEIDMNGREIKNLIRTSILIAKHGKVSLSEEVIMKMYRTYHLGQIAPPIG